jgi:hypothetical protein
MAASHPGVKLAQREGVDTIAARRRRQGRRAIGPSLTLSNIASRLSALLPNETTWTPARNRSLSALCLM